MNWLEKEFDNARSADSEELENRVLLRLFEMWKSENGKKKRALLEGRDDRYATEKAIEDYDKSVYIFILDEAARNSLEVADETVFSHWICDGESAEDKAAYLAERCGGQNSQILEFIKDLRTLQGAKNEKNKSYRYADSKNPRASILWSCALCVISREYLCGSWDGTVSSIISDFDKEVLSNLRGCGYSGVDMDNVIDAYIVFSIYKALSTIKRPKF